MSYTKRLAQVIEPGWRGEEGDDTKGRRPRAEVGGGGESADMETGGRPSTVRGVVRPLTLRRKRRIKRRAAG